MSFSTYINLNGQEDLFVTIDDIESSVDSETETSEFWGARNSNTTHEVKVLSFSLHFDGEQESFDEEGNVIGSFTDGEEIPINQLTSKDLDYLYEKIEQHVLLSEYLS